MNTDRHLNTRGILAWLCTVGVTFLLCTSALQAAQTGEEIFEKKCATCHDLPDPNKPPPEGPGHWKERLDLMAPNAGLSDAQKQKVLEFLTSHEQRAKATMSLAEERRVFEQKCSLCHTIDRVLKIPLTDESRAHIIKRMQARAPDWISEEDVHEIMEYLKHLKEAPPETVPKAGPGEKAGAGPAAVFRKRCSACHTLERVYLKLEQENGTPAWLHIVNRMQKKAPTWITEDEARMIVEYLKTLQPVGDE